MAQVPVYQRQVGTAQPDATPLVPVRTDGLSRGLDQAGNDAAKIATIKLDQEATYQARDADRMFADKMRVLMYDPVTGYMNKRGQEAVDARPEFMKALDELELNGTEGLSKAATNKAYGAITSRVRSAKLSVDGHASTALDEWSLTSAALASESANLDATLNMTPESIRVAQTLKETQLITQADQSGLLGKDKADFIQLKLAENLSSLHTSKAEEIMAIDPFAAGDYLDAHEKEMLPDDINAIRARVQPAIDNKIGAEAAQQAAQGRLPLPAGFSWSNHITGGGSRADGISGLDDVFEQSLANLIASAPDGIREHTSVGSGYRSTARQAQLYAEAVAKGRTGYVAKPGTSQHEFGKAADLSFKGAFLNHAPPEVIAWFHENGPKHGVHFPLKDAKHPEVWHAEALGTRGTAQWVPASGKEGKKRGRNKARTPDPVVSSQSSEEPVDENNIDTDGGVYGSLTPRQQASYQREMSRIASAQAGMLKRQQDAATSKLQEAIENGEDILAPEFQEYRLEAGQAAVESMVDHAATLAAGMPVPETRETLIREQEIMAGDRFLDEHPIMYINELPVDAYKRLLTSYEEGRKPPTWEQAQTRVSQYLSTDDKVALVTANPRLEDELRGRLIAIAEQDPTFWNDPKRVQDVMKGLTAEIWINRTVGSDPNTPAVLWRQDNNTPFDLSDDFSFEDAMNGFEIDGEAVPPEFIVRFMEDWNNERLRGDDHPDRPPTLQDAVGFFSEIFAGRRQVPAHWAK